jgi:Tfp pilus assembly protein PilN
MIRINLLGTAEIRARRGLKAESLMLLGVFVLFVGFLGQLWLRRVVQISTLREEILSSEISIKGLDQLKKESAKLEEIKKNLAMRLETIKDLDSKKGGPWRVLEEISFRTPNALWLTEISETGGRATLTGLATDYASISSFLMSLSRSPRLANVDLVEALEEMKEGKELRRFSAKMEFKYRDATGNLE